MLTKDIRSKFIEFFKSKQHTFVPSSSTIPTGDQTILFTIAGMAQFKSLFTGEEKRPYTRATNAQKCIRVGDLDDVGHDGRHLTMFEMLGSWSFGDYYKKEAIQWAYEFVKDELLLDLSKLWISVHHSDDESIGIWQSVGVPSDRIVRLGDKDNFWAMGPTGPCGPCSELYLDQGEHVGQCYENKVTCRGPGCDCDRFLEFWNLVFMQFNRQEDGTLLDLPVKSVDTGAGLERMTALMQNKTSAFDIDSFRHIKKFILSKAGITKPVAALTEKEQQSLNVLSDHIRMLTVTLADGAHFSNEGRGYVLRRVLRRAMRYALILIPDLDKTKSFLSQLVECVTLELGDFYPEITKNQKRIESEIAEEELRFRTALENGLAKFNSFVDQAVAKKHKEISGEQIFILHDSFGFPSDLTRVLCEEKGFAADLVGFEKYMNEQKERGREQAKFYKFDEDDSPWTEINSLSQKEDKTFSGYHLIATGKKNHDDICEVVIPHTNVKKIRQLKNHLFELVIANTPFYPEGGGQVSDKGWFVIQDQNSHFEFEVIDVRKTPSCIIHLLSSEKHDIKSFIDSKNKVTAVVDLSHRFHTARNHTATHLLHKALQIVLGDKVRQAGSHVSNTGLRFDFSYHKMLEVSEMEKVELLVNSEILKNSLVHTHEDIPLSQAKELGAAAMFDEKYEDFVRMLEVPQFSLELCGGTHVKQTGEIGLFKITSQSSVTSGVRRIEAVTGFGSLEYLKDMKSQLHQISSLLKCAEGDIQNKITSIKEHNKDLEQTIVTLQSSLANDKVLGLLKNSLHLKHDIRCIVTKVEIQTLSELEMLCDRLKEKPNTITVLAAVLENKIHLIAAISQDIMQKHKNISAGNIIKQLCLMLDGKGGGRPDFARGGGTHLEKLPFALDEILTIIRNLLPGE